MYLVNLGISQAKQVLLIADGADWILLDKFYTLILHFSYLMP